MLQCTRCHKTVAGGAERCSHCGAWIDQSAGSSQSDVREPNRESLEQAVRALLGQGQPIAAIKLYRDKTGLGLAAAKDAVERIQRGESPGEYTPATSSVAPTGQDKQLLELLAAGQKIAAIKLYRQQTRLGLKEAKEAVEALAAKHGIATPRSGCLGLLVLGAGLILGFGWANWR
jgi:ribosomal protein L7/L12